jgi:2-methylisocitrate lyase-like PEP mutase family enzyme
VAGALDGGVEDTLEAELVALEGGDALAEGSLGVAGILDTGDGNLLPLNGSIVGLEDGLD